MLIDSEIVISMKPWGFFRDIYIQFAWILKLLQNVSFIVIYHVFILYIKYTHGIVGYWTYLMQKKCYNSRKINGEWYISQGITYQDMTWGK